ncbi:MAG: GerMN domain-containing protein [Oscillospiraceae bacterium]|nr:GerMN domain-containing protein [Oscillospiraceae bacterium]
MKNKKITMYVGIVFLILLICVIGYLVYVNVGRGENPEEIHEYTPQAELPDEELRRTMINLYFFDVATGELKPEARTIESIELLHNPYQRLVELLLEGPQDETKASLIPEDTVLNSAELRGNVVYLDFSEYFVKEQALGEEQERRIIRSIVNTLTELIEVDAVKINIDGNESVAFPDGYVSFEAPFRRER